MIIVVNKMDSAVIPKYGDTRTSKTELVLKVRQHLCENIFHCSEQDLPFDSIIPVSGQWAFYGRTFLMNPSDRNLERQIQVEITNMFCYADESIKKKYIEFTIEEKALYLEERSNIKQLEYR